ncbi:hypothetical protein PLANPX_5325 [Lacipirellula parvula]|uniref:Uncharacterized protein n=1 Tax=Lacipirellula parvula TaxID=2650471 RepID=A0A5K7XMA2_9BACT|nr:hypothetical protein PLANPX_5325 [Lacipirellula parvula]
MDFSVLGNAGAMHHAARETKQIATPAIAINKQDEAAFSSPIEIMRA